MIIDKNQIVFLDTNILSDIGRFDEKTIRDIVFQISVDLKLLVAITPFNILEVEKIPDEAVKTRIKYFLNLVNVIFLKGMDVLLADEVAAYIKKARIEPIMFITTLISKSKDGNPFTYLAVLENLLKDAEYQKALEEHYHILEKQQTHFQNKLPVSNDQFVDVLFKQQLKKFPALAGCEIKSVFNSCPSYVSYGYSLYDKIGSKGLKKKAGEMNDTAMSYIFPYVGIVVTEKRQANLFNSLKRENKIPALNNTEFLKYSDVFVDGKFILKELLNN